MDNKMKVHELTLKVYLLKDIYSKEALEKISQIIDKSLAKDEKFLDFHNMNKYKNYTYNSFYLLEKDKIYKEGKIYSVKIRSINEGLVDYFKKNLINEYTDYMKALTIEDKTITKRYIEKIYSITPCILKTDQGYWKGRLPLDQFERRIKENLIKKYNNYFDTKLDENFQLFQMIKFENIKPISCTYKNIHVLGDKLTLTVSENGVAQDLAYFALGTGILEMNGRGYGFVNYKQL